MWYARQYASHVACMFCNYIAVALYMQYVIQLYSMLDNFEMWHVRQYNSRYTDYNSILCSISCRSSILELYLFTVFSIKKLFVFTKRKDEWFVGQLAHFFFFYLGRNLLGVSTPFYQHFFCSEQYYVFTFCPRAHRLFQIMAPHQWSGRQNLSLKQLYSRNDHFSLQCHNIERNFCVLYGQKNIFLLK